MADEDDEDTPCDIASSVEALERVAFAMSVQDYIVLNLLQGLGGRQVVVGGDFALEVDGFRVVDLDGGAARVAGTSTRGRSW